MTFPGKLVLIIGTSGSGKGVLVRRAMEAHPEIVFAVSTTTRAIRPGETEGHPYYFISTEAFETRIKEDQFLEWATIDGGKLYGTLKTEVLPALESGRIVLKEIEIQGMRQIEQRLPRESVVSIYIDAGPWENLARRIQGRAPISDEELEFRRKRYEYEQSFKDEADYVVTNFDGRFAEADAAFDAILQKLLTSAGSSFI